MIDLHSHLLPGVDDGARDVLEATRTLKMLARQGYTGVALTPHLRASAAARGYPPRFEEAYARLSRARPAGVALYGGVELMLDVPFPALGAPERFTIAGSRYLLVEFPLLVTAQAAASLLAQIVGAGLRPIVAHPERYRACSVAVARAWRAAGAAMQVDATTLTSRSIRGQRARALLAHGLADVLAADNHGDSRTLLTAVRYLHRRGARGVARLLTVDNPRAVVDDRALLPPEPVRFDRWWLRALGAWWGSAARKRQRPAEVG